MKKIKNELQNIIKGDGQNGGESLIKRVQNFLARNEAASKRIESQKQLRSKEEKQLLIFLHHNNLFFDESINESNFIAEGAEQRVYRYDGEHVIKLNDAIFYKSWLDYLNSLLIHNYFFNSTSYQLLGFKMKEERLYAVVKQKFVVANEPINLDLVKEFLEFNHFKNIRNNDFINEELGLIFEDLHDENVLCENGILYFIDTIFYLTNNFYT